MTTWEFDPEEWVALEVQAHLIQEEVGEERVMLSRKAESILSNAIREAWEERGPYLEESMRLPAMRQQLNEFARRLLTVAKATGRPTLGVSDVEAALEACGMWFCDDSQNETDVMGPGTTL